MGLIRNNPSGGGTEFDLIAQAAEPAHREGPRSKLTLGLGSTNHKPTFAPTPEIMPPTRFVC